MVICRICGNEDNRLNRFCTQCGEDLAQSREFQARLVLLSGSQNRAVYDLCRGDNYLGRDVDNSIVVSDQEVSKRHAMIHYDGKNYMVMDLNSRNGVYVNGARITDKQPLIDGSLIKLGSTIFRFEAMKYTL